MEPIMPSVRRREEERKMGVKITGENGRRKESTSQPSPSSPAAGQRGAPIVVLAVEQFLAQNKTGALVFVFGL